MRRLLLLIMLLLILPLVTGEYFAGQNADIRIPARLNGAPSSTMKCNITVYNPNGAVLVGYKEMTNDFANTKTFNYTLPASNTSSIGQYCSDITCFDAGLNATESYCIDINNAGKSYSMEEAITYFIILAVLIGFFILFLVGAIYIPFNNPRNEYGELLGIDLKKYAKLGSMLLCYIMFIWIVFVMWNISYAFVQLQVFSKVFKFFFTVLVGFAFPVSLVIFVMAIMSAVKDNKLKKYMDRNLTIK